MLVIVLFTVLISVFSDLCQVIDAARSIEDVHTDIKEHTVNAINKVEEQPLGELWK